MNFTIQSFPAAFAAYMIGQPLGLAAARASIQGQGSCHGLLKSTHM
jgi:hypothetical protein